MVVTKEMCYYCFEVLENHFDSKKKLTAHALFEDGKYPLFVTWHIEDKNGGDVRLRGCIGNFSPLALHSGLKDYALTSSLRDSRFKSVGVNEVPSLHCAVSLLVNFEVAKDYLDWEIGVHGIWIEFRDENDRKQTATYLPEVMPEQGWTKVEAIDSLLKKGGYRGKVTEEFRKRIILTRYQSFKISCTYKDYSNWKKARLSV